MVLDNDTQSKQQSNIPAEPAEAAPPVELPPFEITVRGMGQTRESGTVVSGATPQEAVKAAFELKDFTAQNPVLQWDGRDKLCCLDIDYHFPGFAYRPSVEWLTIKATGIQPRPFAFHVSHGHGMKMFFAAVPEYTAEELAAVAGLMWLQTDIRATADLVHISRHPGYTRVGHGNCGPVHYQTPGDNLQGATRLFADVQGMDPDERDEQLAKRGWVIGQSLPHGDCLIAPWHVSTNVAPVWIGDEGITCHSCKAAGRSRGKSPGYVPYCVAFDGAKTTPNVVRAMVKNFTHWQHAQHILRHVWPGQSAARRKVLYGVGMKLVHLTDDINEPQREPLGAKIKNAMYCGPDIIRMNGGWCDANGSGRPINEKAQPILIGTLPAVTYVGEDGKAVPRPVVRGALLDGGDTTAHGYSSLRPVLSFDAQKQIGDPDTDVSQGYPMLVPSSPPFGYRPESERVSYIEHLEEQFPGINLAFVKLCIAAFVSSQNPRLTEGPKIMATGPSGSGKSHTVKLAANICGVSTGEASLSGGDMDKFLRSCVAANGFVIVDECAKPKLTPTEFAARALAYRKGNSFHRLHKGTEAVGQPGPMVWMDTVKPSAIVDDRQVARRFVLIDLGAGATCTKDWRLTSGGTDGWRARSEENTRVADCIVSEVLDMFGSCPREWTFEEIAETLGYLTADQGSDGVDTTAEFVSLFLAAMATEDTTDSSYRGKGWKVFAPATQSPLKTAWDACADELGRVDEQLITGRQWAKELGIEGLRVAMVRRGSRVGLRWAVGVDRSPNVTYGRDVIPAGHPLLERLTSSNRVAVDSASPTDGSGQVGTGSGQGWGISEAYSGASLTSI